MTKLPWLLAAAAALSAAGVHTQATTLAPEARLKPTEGRRILCVLQQLDPAAALLKARLLSGGGSLTLRLLPHTSFWRFGAPGAQPQEFGAGDVIVVRGLSTGKPATVTQAAEISDEISEQIRGDWSYTMEGQDRDNYRFTLQRTAAPNQEPAPEKLTLAYGRKTFLVLREDPVYQFRVPAGTRLWVNTGFNPGSDERTAREVLDEVTRDRFRSQQRSRLMARTEVVGARGAMMGGSPLTARIEIYPDYQEWMDKLAPGAGLSIEAGTAPARTGKLRKVSPGFLEIETAPPGFSRAKSGEPVRVLQPRPLSYARDIRPILEANCISCHGAERVQGGYSMATMERMRSGSRRGPGVVPGKSDESMLYLTMSGDRNPRMPPDRDATPAQLKLVKQWIDAGAVVDEAVP